MGTFLSAKRWFASEKYDNESRKANNAAPVFASSSALTVTASGNDVSCVWQAATDDDMVRYYTLTVYNVNDTKKRKSRRSISERLPIATIVWKICRKANRGNSRSTI